MQQKDSLKTCKQTSAGDTTVSLTIGDKKKTISAVLLHNGLLVQESSHVYCFTNKALSSTKSLVDGPKSYICIL